MGRSRNYLISGHSGEHRSLGNAAPRATDLAVSYAGYRTCREEDVRSLLEGGGGEALGLDQMCGGQPKKLTKPETIVDYIHDLSRRDRLLVEHHSLHSASSSWFSFQGTCRPYGGGGGGSVIDSPVVSVLQHPASIGEDLLQCWATPAEDSVSGQSPRRTPHQ